MSDWIDRQMLKADLLCGDDTEHDYCFPCKEILERIDNQPAAQSPARCVAEIKIDKDDLEELVARKVEELKKSMTISAQPEPHWIPRSKRAPRDSELVLLAILDDEDYGDGEDPYVYYDLGIYDLLREAWYGNANGGPLNVLAWMPLQEYREEKE